MGHLSIIMSVKYIIIKILSKVKSFQIMKYMTENCVLKSFKMLKIIKAPTGFVLITYRFARNALAHCTTLLDNDFGKNQKLIK